MHFVGKLFSAVGSKSLFHTKLMSISKMKAEACVICNYIGHQKISTEYLRSCFETEYQ
jgi:hypothetical protein